MHLPDPAISFTIPSIHDDTTLCCRIYHPKEISSCEDTEHPLWQRKGIIVAHPYAPLGGCYDDRVVGFVAEEFLEEGFVVGTFNFRGANPSKGRTSWTGKPELEDYVSFAGFFTHYLKYLLPPLPRGAIPATPEQSPISPTISTNIYGQRGDAQIVLGGYSYGSLILKHLPPVGDILKIFAGAEEGTAVAEVLLRAQKLADQTNKEWEERVLAQKRQQGKKNRSKHSHDNSLSVQMGGEETSPEKRRNSQETRRSLDIHHSLDLHRSFKSISLRRKKQEHNTPIIETPTSTASLRLPSISYLLVSPLQQPLCSALAPSLGGNFWNKSKAGHDTIVQHPTLAVFGDHDFFTPIKKQRSWSESLSKETGSKFTYVEIPGAGHFWHEPGAESQLRDTLQSWIRQHDHNP